MFYCDPCGGQNGWPIVNYSRSYGACEICNGRGSCNDVPSSFLPPPPDTSTDDAIESIKDTIRKRGSR